MEKPDLSGRVIPPTAFAMKPVEGDSTQRPVIPAAPSFLRYVATNLSSWFFQQLDVAVVDDNHIHEDGAIIGSKDNFDPSDSHDCPANLSARAAKILPTIPSVVRITAGPPLGSVAPCNSAHVAPLQNAVVPDLHRSSKPPAADLHRRSALSKKLPTAGSKSKTPAKVTRRSKPPRTKAGLRRNADSASTAPTAPDPEPSMNLPFKLVNHWLLMGRLKKIPSNVFELNRRDKTAELKTDANSDEFLLGHNTAFMYKPNVWPIRPGEIRYIRDRQGRVLVAASVNEAYAVCFDFPVVYYCHKDGFILNCRIGWEHKDEQFKNPHFEGTVEVVGTYGNRIFTRTYSVVEYSLDSAGYRKVTLSSELGCNTAKTFFVHDLCLITFRGKRPEGLVGHHLGGVTDNNIKKLKWSTPSEISLYEAQCEPIDEKDALEYAIRSLLDR